MLNDSIAPNAYMLARKSAWPGMSVRHAMPPKIRIPTHGVPYFGCSWRRRAGAECEEGGAAEDEDPDSGSGFVRMQLARTVGGRAVEPHRVPEPRDPDDAGVGRDEEDRRRQQADVDLRRPLEEAEVELLDDS